MYVCVKYIFFSSINNLVAILLASFMNYVFGVRTYIIFKRYKLLEIIDENDKAATSMLINRLYQTIPSLIFPSPRSYLALSAESARG